MSTFEGFQFASINADMLFVLSRQVSGKTIFNVPTLGEGEMGADDRPLHPHKILRTEILNNPFDDIVPRASMAVKADVKQDTKPKPKGAKYVSSGAPAANVLLARCLPHAAVASQESVPAFVR